MAMAKQWNPMEAAYKNTEFNKYKTGPGASLDDDMQPAALAQNGSNKPIKVILKNVPKDMTMKALTNLCSNYAKISNMYNPKSCPFYFVAVNSLNDMERLLTGLKGNLHGIIAEPARERTENAGYVPQNQKSPPSRESHNSYNNSNQIDMSRRSITGPFTNPSKPKPIEKKPLVTEQDYENSNLKIADPQKHFLIQGDMHDSDRQDPRRNSQTGNQGKQVHTGRSYYVEQKDISDKLSTLSNSSKGSFNKRTNEYKKLAADSFDGESVGHCNVCGKISNKVCQRCGDSYCSFECQRKDWSKHRYICLPMPNLVTAQEFAAVPLPEQSPNLTTKGAGEKNHNYKAEIKNSNTNYKSAVPANNSFSKPVNSKMNYSPQKNDQSVDKHEDTKDDSPPKTSEVPQANATIPVPPPQASKPAPASVPKAELPESGSIVCITAYNKTNLVFVRSLAPEDNTDYVKNLNTINNEGKKMNPVTELPKRGDLLITDFQETGFYRVLVIAVENEEKITVAFLDFGNVEVKKMSDLRELPPAICDLKRYAHPIRLKGVEDFEANEKIKEYLNEYVDCSGKDLKMTYEKTDGKPEAELIDVATNESINKKIMQLREVKVAELCDPPVMNNDIENKLLPAGDNVTVFVLDNSLLSMATIYCITEKDLIKLQEFNVRLQEYAAKVNDFYTPREGEICLVQYEGEWSRAECLEVVGDGNPSVQFIDYGNISATPIENIRKCPKDLTFPCYTSGCFISGLPDIIDEKTIERLKELLPANEQTVLEKVTVDLLEGESTNVIYLPTILETLRNEKLI